MSYIDTPILTADVNQEEEKIILSSTPRLIIKSVCSIFFIFCTIVIGIICYNAHYPNGKNYIFLIIFLIIGVAITVFICFIADGVEVIINNKNRTLKLQKFSNCCFKKKPKIIDLNKAEKINIMHSDSNKIFNKYLIIYKNGETEDLSNYFNGYSDRYLLDCQNLLKKYLPVENAMPQMMSMFPQ